MFARLAAAANVRAVQASDKNGFSDSNFDFRAQRSCAKISSEDFLNHSDLLAPSHNADMPASR
jgi:hypothetical protein